MRQFSIAISEDLRRKITVLAKQKKQSVEDCINQALYEYIETSQDNYKTDLCAVDNLERSFFLSIGE